MLLRGSTPLVPIHDAPPLRCPTGHLTLVPHILPAHCCSIVAGGERDTGFHATLTVLPIAPRFPVTIRGFCGCPHSITRATAAWSAAATATCAHLPAPVVLDACHHHACLPAHHCHARATHACALPFLCTDISQHSCSFMTPGFLLPRYTARMHTYRCLVPGLRYALPATLHTARHTILPQPAAHHPPATPAPPAYYHHATPVTRTWLPGL